MVCERSLLNLPIYLIIVHITILLMHEIKYDLIFYTVCKRLHMHFYKCVFSMFLCVSIVLMLIAIMK
jgi:hypothetical protein